jgi:hypothetical protein
MPQDSRKACRNQCAETDDKGSDGRCRWFSSAAGWTYVHCFPLVLMASVATHRSGARNPQRARERHNPFRPCPYTQPSRIGLRRFEGSWTSASGPTKTKTKECRIRRRQNHCLTNIEASKPQRGRATVHRGPGSFQQGSHRARLRSSSLRSPCSVCRDGSNFIALVRGRASGIAVQDVRG